jgi:FkbM family methyltransferase
MISGMGSGLTQDKEASSPEEAFGQITRVGGLLATVGRGARVLAAMRAQFESVLWRREAQAQVRNLLAGELSGRTGGRDHDNIPPANYRRRKGEGSIWLRHGTGDAAVWGEVFVAGQYTCPWPVPRGAAVLDLGGHAGYFGLWAWDSWAAQSVISVEPDEDNLRLLHLNRREADRQEWRVLEGAASVADGRASFAGGRGCGSRLAEGGEDEVVTFDVLPLLERCTVAKIDIEGGEWEILVDPRFAQAAPPLLVLEYHATAQIADPRTYATTLLEQNGYEVQPGDEPAPGVGLLWARRGHRQALRPG